MFEGFTHDRIVANGVGINLRYGGSGPPLLLLHGYPQTHVMWHKVAPRSPSVTPSWYPTCVGTATATSRPHRTAT